MVVGTHLTTGGFSPQGSDNWQPSFNLMKTTTTTTPLLLCLQGEALPSWLCFLQKMLRMGPLYMTLLSPSPASLELLLSQLSRSSLALEDTVNTRPLLLVCRGRRHLPCRKAPHGTPSRRPGSSKARLSFL